VPCLLRAIGKIGSTTGTVECLACRREKVHHGNPDLSEYACRLLMKRALFCLSESFRIKHCGPFVEWICNAGEHLT